MEPAGPLRPLVVDDNGGIVLDCTVVIDLPKMQVGEFDRPSRGGEVSLPVSDKRRTVGCLGSEGKAVIGL